MKIVRRGERKVEWQTWGQLKLVQGYSAKEVLQIIEMSRKRMPAKDDDDKPRPVG